MVIILGVLVIDEVFKVNGVESYKVEVEWVKVVLFFDGGVYGWCVVGDEKGGYV